MQSLLGKYWAMKRESVKYNWEKAKRMKVEICNYEAFSEALRADVYRKLLDYIKFCDKGVRTYYKMDTKKNKDKE